MLLVIVKRNLADCLVKLVRIQEAYQYTTESVALSRQLGVSLDTGEALCEYAKVLEVSGRPKEALGALNEAPELFARGGFDHYVLATQLQRAELLLALKEYERAYKEASALKEYFDTHGLLSRSVDAVLLLVGSLILKAQHEKEHQSTLLREAVVLCRQATSLALHHNLQEQVYRGQHLLGQLAVLQGNTAAASKRYGAAIAQIECILDDLVHDLSPSFLHTTWKIYEDQAALYSNYPQLPLHSNSIATYSGDVPTLASVNNDMVDALHGMYFTTRYPALEANSLNPYQTVVNNKWAY